MLGASCTYGRKSQILHLTSIALPLLGFCELGNSTQAAACGILIGSARPQIGCYINFISFYLIGLPVAALLGFRSSYGFAGFWMGLAAAQISFMCLMVSNLVCINWTHQASMAFGLLVTTSLGGVMCDSLNWLSSMKSLLTSSPPPPRLY